MSDRSMDSDLFDEDGYYVGPDHVSDSENSSYSYYSSQYTDEGSRHSDEDATGHEDEKLKNAPMSVVLHKDKKCYPQIVVHGPDVEADVQEENSQALDKPLVESIVVHGPDVEAGVQEEKSQALDKPLVEPIKQKKLLVQEEQMPASI